MPLIKPGKEQRQRKNKPSKRSLYVGINRSRSKKHLSFRKLFKIQIFHNGCRNPSTAPLRGMVEILHLVLILFGQTAEISWIFLRMLAGNKNLLRNMTCITLKYQESSLPIC